MRVAFVLQILLGAHFALDGILCSDDYRLLTLSVVPRETDYTRRLQKASAAYGLDIKVITRTELQNSFPKRWSWNEIAAIREEVAKYKEEKDLVIILAEGCCTILSANASFILENFLKLDSNVVLGSSSSSLPSEYQQKYPPSGPKFKFANGGIVIGFAPKLHEVLQSSFDHPPSSSVGGPRFFFQDAFLSDDVQKKVGIKLDHDSQLIHTFADEKWNVELEYFDGDAMIFDLVHDTFPSILHAGTVFGESQLTNYGNYLMKSWSIHEKCIDCKQNNIDLEAKEEKDYPRVLIGVFVDDPTRDLDKMLDKVFDLDYPKKRIVLLIYNHIMEHQLFLEGWIEAHKEFYENAVIKTGEEKVKKKGEAIESTIEYCREMECDAFFYTTTKIQFNEPKTLKDLIASNRSIIAPIVQSMRSYQSNFWSGVKNNFYDRGYDFFELEKLTHKGIWQVPYIYATYLILRRAMERPSPKLNYLTYDGKAEQQQDMAFTKNNRLNQVAMYMINNEQYAFFQTEDKSDPESFRKQIWSNEFDRKLIRPGYNIECTGHCTKESLKGCPKVFPLFKDEFCRRVIQAFIDYKHREGAEENNLVEVEEEEEKPKMKSFVDLLRLPSIYQKYNWRDVVDRYLKPMVASVYPEANIESKDFFTVIGEYPAQVSPYIINLEPAKYVVRIPLNTDIHDFKESELMIISPKCAAIPMESGDAIVHKGQENSFEGQFYVRRGTKYELRFYINM